MRRFARAERVEQLLVKARSRTSLLGAYKPYLHKRFNTGQTDAAALTEEITALGYRGSDKTVRCFCTHSRPPSPLRPPIRTHLASGRSPAG